MATLKERIQSPTPRFWKKVIRGAVAIGVIAGGILVAPVALPAALITAAGYGVTIGVTGLLLAKLTKVDVSDIQGMSLKEKAELKETIAKVEEKRDLNEHELKLKAELEKSVLS